MYIWASLFDVVSPSDANQSTLFGEEEDSWHNPVGAVTEEGSWELVYFFLSPEGRRNPISEWRVSLEFPSSSVYVDNMERACPLEGKLFQKNTPVEISMCGDVCL